MMLKKYEVRLRVEMATGAEAVTTVVRQAETAAAAEIKARAHVIAQNMHVLETLGIWSKQ
jgi:hypothetical protein